MTKKKTGAVVATKTSPANRSKKNYKITDDQFFDELRANAGILARTARAIEKKYNIAYSRQAVEERAKRNPEILQEIRAAAIDDAEEILITLMRTGSEKVRADIVKFYLKTIGKDRGYTEKIEQHNTGEVAVTTVRVEHFAAGLPLANSESEVLSRLDL